MPASSPLPDGLPLGRGSVSWRVVREPAVVALGAGRALLLQVAHPSVAAGVEQHSTYRSDPWGRLFRTLDTMLKLAFAPSEVGARKADLLARRHRTVAGVTDEGAAYRALDPELLVWVWATLVDSSLLGYQRGVGRLAVGDADRFVREQTLVAEACGVPVGTCPDSAAALRDLVARVVAHDLRIGDTARTVAGQIVRPPVAWPLRPLAGAANALLTTALLPAELRAPLGLEWSEGRDRAARAAFAACRAGGRVVPARARSAPVGHLVRRSRPVSGRAPG